VTLVPGIRAVFTETDTLEPLFTDPDPPPSTPSSRMIMRMRVRMVSYNRYENSGTFMRDEGCSVSFSLHTESQSTKKNQSTYEVIIDDEIMMKLR
jgi:hypothetical protein